jgi:hypothetical protein
LRSTAFRAAAERAMRSRRAIVAGLFAPPSRDAVFDAPVVDLTEWDGVDGAALAPLFDAVDALLHPTLADVIILPSRPIYEDAEFSETTLMITSADSGRASATRRAWEAPIPTRMLRPVSDEPSAEPKRGAQRRAAISAAWESGGNNLHERMRRWRSPPSHFSAAAHSWRV